MATLVTLLGMSNAVYFKIPLTLEAISKLVSGTIFGSPTASILGIASSEEPVEGCVVFIKGKNATQRIVTLNGTVGALGIENEKQVGTPQEQTLTPRLLVKDTSKAIRTLLELVEKERAVEPQTGISELAVIHPTAKIDTSAYVGPYCIIGEGAVIKAHTQLVANVFIDKQVEIGEYCKIHSHVCIREKSRIGNHVVIHNGSVIGADGFGFVPSPTGIQKVPQLGIVSIEDRVEIGAVVSIDRATVGTTRIGYGTKIDNQVQVGHNVQVGKFCILCACTKIGGSSVLEDGVVCGGGTGIADHVRLVSGVRLGAAAQVVTDLLECGDYAGSPAMRAAVWRRALVTARKT